MNRVGKMAEEQAKIEGVEFIPFTFHDIKRRACSDYIGNKIAATGHRSEAMMKIYDVSIPVAKPTRE
jgi:hypothetical protein